MPPRLWTHGAALTGALLLASAYLPSLTTGFDFIDDGNLVYPATPMPFGERLSLVWQKIEANYEHLGPFRPVLWAHWELQAELFDGNPFLWRLARLSWTAFAAGMLVWLLRELRFSPLAAFGAAALAIWNPYRGEIWRSLTLSEGVAMPYALLGLVCAVRAARSERPWRWDLLGAVSVLLALGCKNTFAALVPAQLLLRLAPDGGSLRQAWTRHGLRSLVLAMPLLLPIGHFLIFKLSWRPGQYETGVASLSQTWGMIRAVAGAVSLDMVGAGLLLTALALFAGRRLAGLWASHAGVIRAALALLICGIGVYLPIQGISGRYAIPAVLGVDLLIGVALTELDAVVAARWRRLAFLAFGAGLAAVLLANIGRQEKFAARADLLWQVLLHVEQTAPSGTTVGWVEGAHLNREEGIHFLWHLHARGRTDLSLQLLDAAGRSIPRSEISTSESDVGLYVEEIGGAVGATGDPRVFTASYWGGLRRYQVQLWRNP